MCCGDNAENYLLARTEAKVRESSDEAGKALYEQGDLCGDSRIRTGPREPHLSPAAGRRLNRWLQIVFGRVITRSHTAQRRGNALRLTAKSCPDDLRSAGHPLFQPRYQDAAPPFHSRGLTAAIEFPILTNGVQPTFGISPSECGGHFRQINTGPGRFVVDGGRALHVRPDARHAGRNREVGATKAVALDANLADDRLIGRL